MASMSASLFRGVVDQLFQASPRLAVHVTGPDVEERRQSALGGAAEKGVQHVLERRAPSRFARDGGPVVVARSVLFDAQVSLGHEDAQGGADGGVGGRTTLRILVAKGHL